jgi:hypothetical protein
VEDIRKPLPGPPPSKRTQLAFILIRIASANGCSAARRARERQIAGSAAGIIRVGDEGRWVPPILSERATDSLFKFSQAPKGDQKINLVRAGQMWSTLVELAMNLPQWWRAHSKAEKEVKRRYRTVQDAQFAKSEAQMKEFSGNPKLEPGKIGAEYKIQTKPHLAFYFRDVAQHLLDKYRLELAVAIFSNLHVLKDRHGMNPKECILKAIEFLVDKMPTQLEPMTPTQYKGALIDRATLTRDGTRIALGDPRFVANRIKPPVVTYRGIKIILTESKLAELGGFPRDDTYQPSVSDNKEEIRQTIAAFLTLCLFTLDIEGARRLFSTFENGDVKRRIMAKLKALDEGIATLLS